MSSLQARIIAAFFALFVAVPLVAHVVGVRPGEVDNRRLAEAPAVEPSEVLDENYYADWTSYLNDTFPFRSAAIRFNLRTEEAVFGSTSTDVVQGDDGWLYLARSFTRPCEAELTPDEAIAVFAGFLDTIEQSGISSVSVVSPSKFRIHPEHLGDDGERRSECATEEGERLEEGLASAQLPGYTDLWSPLRSAADEADQYFRTDTHWNDSGAMLMLEALTEGSGIGWEPDSIVDGGIIEWEGDLTRLKGTPSSESAQRLTVERAMGSDVLEGRTLLIHDSFFEPGLLLHIRDSFAEYTEDVVFVHWDDLDSIDLPAEIEQADRVVIQVAERLFGLRMAEIAEMGLVEAQ